jgi:hypothetical protein
LDPQIGSARQNAFCERQDAFYVEFLKLAGVTVDACERELLAEFLGVTVVRVDVDEALEEERLVQTVELLLNRVGRAFGGCDFFLNGGLARLPDSQAPIPLVAACSLASAAAMRVRLRTDLRVSPSIR